MPARKKTSKPRVSTPPEEQILLPPVLPANELTKLPIDLTARLQAVARSSSSLASMVDRLAGEAGLAALAKGDDPRLMEAQAIRLRDELVPLEKDLGRLLEELTAWRESERRSCRQRFEAGIQDNKLAMAGHWPEPVVQHTVFVVVDVENERATVNGQTISGLLTADKLLKTVVKELGELRERAAPPEAFGRTLWQAYQEAGGRPGEGQGIFDILHALVWQRQSKGFRRDPRKETFRPYSLAQFRADLTNYLAAGSLVVPDGQTSYRLEIAAGSFAQDGLFMYFPQTDRLGTCGRLTFHALDPGANS